MPEDIKGFKVYTVNAHGYKRSMEDKETECFAMSIAELDQAIALCQEDDATLAYLVTAHDDRLDAPTPLDEVLQKLPKEYHDFADVFDRK